MKYLILSDIHANFEALKAVLKDADKRAWEKVLILGDLTGYNANPNEVISKVQELEAVGKLRGALLGNHDEVVIGNIDPELFNEKAKKAALWTKETVTKQNKEWLAKLHLNLLIESDLLIVHGSPLDPNEYLLMTYQAKMSFQIMNDDGIRICFNGHTHVPCVFKMTNSIVERTNIEGDFFKLNINNEDLYIINPGSVGQPRDGNNKASYAIYDSDTCDYYMFRVSYDLLQTQRKILEAGLPEELALRLQRGL